MQGALRIRWWCAIGLLLAACGTAHRPVQGALEERVYTAHLPDFDGDVYVVEAGAAHAPPLVLIHGLGHEGAQNFAPIIPALAQHYRVLAFDLPGFGRSPRDDKHYSPEAYARFVHVMVGRYFHTPVSVLGHSMGGAIALLFASQYPDDVARLALMDVAGILHFRDYTRTVVNAKLSRRGDAFDPLRRFAHALFRVGTRPFAGVEIADLPMLQTSTVQFIQYDFGAAIRAVRAPVWLGWGAEDTSAPMRTMHTLRYLLRPERVVIYPNADHFPMRSQPVQVASDLHAFFSAAPRRASESPAAIRQSAGSVRCAGEHGRIFEGVYDHIALHGCKNAVLRNVTARSILLRSSSADLTHVEITDGDVGLSVNRSRLTYTGGHIVSDICIDLAGSRLNMAGVECVYKQAAVRMRGRSDFVASVSGAQRLGKRTSLHGKYD